jgi:Co/Zn/Cd efflux system component
MQESKSWYSRLRKLRNRLGIYVHGHNAIPLLLATFLFFAIAITQFYYATIANSSALKADSICMFADAISFLGAFLAEVIPSGKLCAKEKLELGVNLL